MNNIRNDLSINIVVFVLSVCLCPVLCYALLVVGCYIIYIYRINNVKLHFENKPFHKLRLWCIIGNMPLIYGRITTSQPPYFSMGWNFALFIKFNFLNFCIYIWHGNHHSLTYDYTLWRRRMVFMPDIMQKQKQMYFMKSAIPLNWLQRMRYRCKT